MQDLMNRILSSRVNKTKENFTTGDTVEVNVRVKEGDKERIQVFKGTVIKIQGSGLGRSFTVRKMSSGVGVERTFPFVSPNVESVKLVAHGKVRRSRLYYLRGLKGKKARISFELAREEKAKKTNSKTAETPAE